MLFLSCKNSDSKVEPWQETTKVDSPYLYKVTIEENGAERLFRSYEINSQRELISVRDYKSLKFYDTISKNNSGKIVSISYRNEQENFHTSYSFNYNEAGRISSRSRLNHLPNRIYNCDATGRLASCVEGNLSYVYFYSTATNNPDSVQTIVDTTLIETAIYTYDNKPTPYKTLPVIVNYLEDIYWSNVVQSHAVRNSGVIISNVRFICSYDALGLLIEKQFEGQNKKYKYYYK